jgi:hypothetical protein
MRTADAAQPEQKALPTMPGVLSPPQMAAFERDGFILTKAPLSEQELDEAEATFDRLLATPEPEGGANWDEGRFQVVEDDRGFLKLMAHPWFESVAQQVLRAERVRYIEYGPHHRPAAANEADGRGAAPKGDAAQQAWADGCHIDLQVTTTDWDATPRRDLLALWLWVSDVPPERAAMRILPGSHRAIHEHWEKTLLPGTRCPVHAANQWLSHRFLPYFLRLI